MISNEIDYELLGRIRNDFFDGGPVHIREELTGQSIDDHGDFLLGCTAGPSRKVDNLIHEMAHMADRSIPKLLGRPHNWGYNVGDFWQIGTSWGYEPQNCKGVLTEIRVWAYQYNLMKYYGMDPSLEDLVSSVVYMGDFFIFKHEYVPRVDDRSDGEEEAVRIAARMVSGLASTTHTFQAFTRAWDERMLALTAGVK